jgi:hypothetical protein
MGRASELVNISTLGAIPTFTLPSPQYMIETNSSSSRVLLKNAW